MPPVSVARLRTAWPHQPGLLASARRRAAPTSSRTAPVRASAGASAAPTPSAEGPEPGPPTPSPRPPVERHTLGAVYLDGKAPKGVKLLDHDARRRERQVAEVAQAARKVGLSEQQVRANIEALESLLPGLGVDLNKMRASDYVQLLRDVPRVANTIVILKANFPGADVARIVQVTPKILLKAPEQIQQDADVVRRALAAAHDVDAIIEQVPYLLDPRALAQSLSNISRWYNTQDPVGILEKDPKVLLNVEESDLPADPLYGELTTAG